MRRLSIRPSVCHFRLRPYPRTLLFLFSSHSLYFCTIFFTLNFIFHSDFGSSEHPDSDHDAPSSSSSTTSDATSSSFFPTPSSPSQISTAPATTSMTSSPPPLPPRTSLTRFRNGDGSELRDSSSSELSSSIPTSPATSPLSPRAQTSPGFLNLKRNITTRLILC